MRQIFATLWFLLFMPLIVPDPPSACKIITKPLPWDGNQIRPWNIFNRPKPTKPPASSTTSYQPPSCICGEKVGAGAKQHPWLVGIGLANDEDGALLCSGSLITTDTVLTAASCLQQLTPALLSILVILSFGFHQSSALLRWGDTVWWLGTVTECQWPRSSSTPTLTQSPTTPTWLSSPCNNRSRLATGWGWFVFQERGLLFKCETLSWWKQFKLNTY